MPGTIVIDSGATFAAMLLLSAAPKTRFGTDEPDISKDGERKYSCEVAVTFRPDSGMRAVSEVVTVTVTGGADPSTAIAPGTPVEFDRLRLGVSSPERRDNGRISGGKPFYMASGIRAAHGANGGRPAKQDAAA
jgi:hypothetical protein